MAKLRSLNPTEQGHVKAVIAHAQSDQGKLELLICSADSDGSEIDRTIDQPDKAHLTPAMVDWMEGEDCRLWHNHPEYGSLSDADWRLAVAHTHIVEIAATNESGSLFRGAVADGARLSSFVQAQFRGVVQYVSYVDASAEASDKLLAGQDPKLNLFLEAFSGHVVNECLQEKGIIEYEAVFSDIDTALFTLPASKAALAEAKTAVLKFMDNLGL